MRARRRVMSPHAKNTNRTSPRAPCECWGTRDARGAVPAGEGLGVRDHVLGRNRRVSRPGTETLAVGFALGSVRDEAVPTAMTHARWRALIMRMVFPSCGSPRTLVVPSTVPSAVAIVTVAPADPLTCAPNQPCADEASGVSAIPALPAAKRVPPEMVMPPFASSAPLPAFVGPDTVISHPETGLQRRPL